MRKFGEIEIPLLADVDRSAATAYGVWTPTIGAKPGEGEAAHGAFIVDCEGIVRWAYVGDRPFTDVDALLHELARLSRETPGLKVDHKL
jgi:alkyl hydroperoxide reductase subunit AhpC